MLLLLLPSARGLGVGDTGGLFIPTMMRFWRITFEQLLLICCVSCFFNAKHHHFASPFLYHSCHERATFPLEASQQPISSIIPSFLIPPNRLTAVAGRAFPVHLFTPIAPRSGPWVSLGGPAFPQPAQLGSVCFPVASQHSPPNRPFAAAVVHHRRSAAPRHVCPVPGPKSCPTPNCQKPITQSLKTLLGGRGGQHLVVRWNQPQRVVDIRKDLQP